MSFDIVGILNKKRENQNLSKEEIYSFVDAVHKDTIPNYQIAAFLMAVAIHGFSDQETTWLTVAMAESGSVYRIPDKKGRIFIDKHSSGGIGDKTSLILLPILVAAGLYVLKASGRGLGFTGGTLDKLESIGVKINLTYEESLKIIDKSKILLIAQSKDVSPVDKKLYALRDVTGTVASIPLIASSIMSKKMCFEVDYLFLDVKYGTGAFCNTLEMATELSKAMYRIGRLAKMNVFVHITSMQQPLGYAVGNAIEILESQDFLAGKPAAPDLHEFIVKFAADAMVTTGLYKNEEDAKVRVLEILKNQEALRVCENWFECQGGDVESYKKQTYFAPKYKKEVLAKKSGYYSVSENWRVGDISNKLGAGRVRVEDVIDFQAGIHVHKKLNDYVKEGDLLYTLYASAKPIDEKLADEILEITNLTPDKHKVDELVILYKE